MQIGTISKIADIDLFDLSKEYRWSLEQLISNSYVGWNLEQAYRGLPFMTSAKFSDFFTPCPHFHANFLTTSAFPWSPSPLECGRHKWKPHTVQTKIIMPPKLIAATSISLGLKYDMITETENDLLIFHSRVKTHAIMRFKIGKIMGQNMGHFISFLYPVLSCSARRLYLSMSWSKLLSE